jgi:hypothetical protein
MQGGVDAAGVDAAYQASMQLRNCVVNNVRYRCEIGHRLQKQYTTLAQQANYLNNMAQGSSMPMAAGVANVPYAPSGYAPGYASSYMPYGNESEYYMDYSQDPAQQYQQQMQAQVQMQQRSSSPPVTAVHPEQQAPYPYATPAKTFPLGSASFSPTHMVSQILNSNRSPTNYELSLLRSITPRTSVPVGAQAQPHMVTPQGVFANPYMSGQGMAMPLTSGGALAAPAPGQYGQQQPSHVPQYMYPYFVPSNSTTPTHANPEMGLRARSGSSDGTVSYGTPMPMPMMMMVPVQQVTPGGQYAGNPPPLRPVNATSGYMMPSQYPGDHQGDDSAQQPSPDQEASAQDGTRGPAYGATTPPRGSCSEHFGLNLKVSTEPAPGLSAELPMAYNQQLGTSSDSTAGGYATRTDTTRNAMYRALSPLHAFQYMQQQQMAQAQQQAMYQNQQMGTELRAKVVSPQHQD